MIRYAYIYNQILQLYRNLDNLSFPLDPREPFQLMDNCKLMTYQTFSKINQCTLQEVFLLCESQSGCTHYDITKNQYLVLFNSSTENNNVSGRIRWTLAHELGHIVLNHLLYIAEPLISEHNSNNLSNHSELEAEANYFAATVLCPMPLFEILGIQSVTDVQQAFGLSFEASKVRWKEYIKWKFSHRKTAWENDLKRIYLNKESLSESIALNIT